MKEKSVINDVFLEKWKTPVCKARLLWLDALFQTTAYTHFFFSTGINLRRSKKRKHIYVMTIGRTWPYRLIEEEYAYSCIGKYFRPDPLKPKKEPRRDYKPQRTWKLWGTSFIKELDEGKALSDYKEERDKNIFEYFIRTEDEWIEFVSGPPRWEVLRDMTVKSAVRRYLKEV